ncbi:DUF2897 family protein [Algibacillus agarilyticus]|uniref:DUF2897 family protein n=1 Tax=Algibacillus agarilyticus TaxID=2234133 RepID=UPI000DCFFCB9|nr:DUF2897 family protein [Algibacillus agarilyticus]
MEPVTMLILALVVAFGFVAGGILMLQNNSKFKFPENWEKIREENRKHQEALDKKNK